MTPNSIRIGFIVITNRVIIKNVTIVSRTFYSTDAGFKTVQFTRKLPTFRPIRLVHGSIRTRYGYIAGFPIRFR